MQIKQSHPQANGHYSNLRSKNYNIATALAQIVEHFVFQRNLCACARSVLCSAIHSLSFSIIFIELANSFSYQTKKLKSKYSAKSSHNSSNECVLGQKKFVCLTSPPPTPRTWKVLWWTKRDHYYYPLYIHYKWNVRCTVPPYHQFWWNIFQFHNEINMFGFIIFMV